MRPGANLAFRGAPRAVEEAGAGAGGAEPRRAHRLSPSLAGRGPALACGHLQRPRQRGGRACRSPACPPSHYGASFSTPGIHQTALPAPEPTSSCHPSPPGERTGSGGIPGAGDRTHGWGGAGLAACPAQHGSCRGALWLGTAVLGLCVEAKGKKPGSTGRTWAAPGAAEHVNTRESWDLRWSHGPASRCTPVVGVRLLRPSPSRGQQLQER